MKKKKIYMYGAVTALLPIATVATIISCGDDNSKTDQNKMDGITGDMVKKALNITVDPAALPSSVTQPTSIPPATINGLDGVEIIISAWDNQNDVKGEITATVDIAKLGLNSPSPFNIVWTGYLTTDQSKMNTITGDMVKTALNITVDPAALPSSVTQPTSIPPATINGLDGVEIIISTWDNQDDVNGEITATVAISKVGLTAPTPFSIIWTGYLTTDQSKMNTITGDMVKTALNITVDPAALPSSVTQPTIIPPATINGLDGVEIIISAWDNQNDVKGEITATVAISKVGLTAPTPFSIIWTGYLTTDQSKMNTITGDMVKTALNITVDPAALPSSVTQPTSIPPATINGLDGVEIIISTWDNQDDVNGEITATVAISKVGLTAPTPFSIIWTGYKKMTFTIDNSNVVASKGKWWDYDSASKTLTVNPGVVGLINTSATEGLFDVAIPVIATEVEHVDLPDTLTTIGGYAFYSSTLTSLTIPNSVTAIGEGAFSSSTLTSLTIPDSVTAIGDFAFGDSLLTTLNLGNSVTTIGWYAFQSSLLTSLIIPDSVTTIGDAAFLSSTLTSLTLGNSVTSIGDNAFSSSTLSSLTIPNSVTTIGDSAFHDSLLTSLTIPNSVTTIGDNAFSSIANVATTNVTMPSAFKTDSLKDIIFGGSNWDKIAFTWT